MEGGFDYEDDLQQARWEREQPLKVLRQQQESLQFAIDDSRIRKAETINPITRSIQGISIGINSYRLGKVTFHAALLEDAQQLERSSADEGEI